jgi:hypothetical protein
VYRRAEGPGNRRRVERLHATNSPSSIPLMPSTAD